MNDKMHDPYDDQLRAALYRAERDRVRAELAKVKAELDKCLESSGVELLFDHDGELIVPGETRFGLSDGREWMIDAVGRGFAWAGLNRTAQAKGKQPTRLRPEWLTKQRPAKALDVNEAEVREGDVVWVARTGAGPYTVEKVWDCQPAPDRGQLRNPFTAKWAVKVEGSPEGVFYLAKDLTHERPDSWERIEEDARLKPSEYADRYRIGRIGFEAEDMCVDLVRRAKKLAGEA